MIDSLLIIYLFSWLSIIAIDFMSLSFILTDFALRPHDIFSNSITIVSLEGQEYTEHSNYSIGWFWI